MEINLLHAADWSDVDHFLDENVSVPTQLPIWSNILAAGDDSIESAYLVASENGRIRGVLPGFFIDTAYGSIYNSVPYPGGYGGVVADSPDVYRVLLNRLIEIARQRGCVLVSIANSPWKEDLELYREHFQPDCVYKIFVNYIPLEKDLQLHSRIQYDIRKAKKNGVVATDALDEGNLKKFYALFERLMQHFGSPHLDYSFFERVAEQMVPKCKAKYLFALKDGEVISGVLLLIHAGVIEYFHTAAHPDYKALQPNSLLIEQGIAWGLENKCTHWNFQSTRVRGNPTHKFKIRWGSDETFNYYFTKILGDCDKLLEDGYEHIRQRYPFYYFLPQGYFADPGQAFFEK